MATDSEVIESVCITDAGELLLRIKGNGKAMYQHIYREAAGVYWDKEECGFKSTPMRDWSCQQWFTQIVEVCGHVSIELELSPTVEFSSVPFAEQKAIREAYAT